MRIHALGFIQHALLASPSKTGALASGATPQRFAASMLTEDWASLDASTGKLDEDLVSDTGEQSKQQARPALDSPFK